MWGKAVPKDYSATLRIRTKAGSRVEKNPSARERREFFNRGSPRRPEGRALKTDKKKTVTQTTFKDCTGKVT